ncbi:MAG: FG-GAP-like repeat-containing protein [Terracidiphilus sp.]
MPASQPTPGPVFFPSSFALALAAASLIPCHGMAFAQQSLPQQRASTLHLHFPGEQPRLLATPLLSGVRLAAQAEQGTRAEKPLVRFRSPQSLKLKYTGAAKAVRALEGGGATPTMLASADFNADGARDVVAGYATKDGGVLTLLLGNPDAYAPTDAAMYEKAMRGNIPDSFLPTARVFAVPESPDVLVTGDFNRDAHQDVLVASRGGRLYLLAGDGKGGLLAPQLVPLAGAVSALAVTGDGHVAVSMEGPSGAKLQILAPSSRGLIAGRALKLPERGDSVAWSDLGGGADLAVTAGSNVVVIYNALSARPHTEMVALPFEAQALAPGNFIWDRDGRMEISVLARDGSVHILQHGTLDTRPLTAADAGSRRAELRAERKQRPDPESLGPWTVAKTLPDSGPPDSTAVSPSAFNSPRLAASPTEDLLVLDGARNLLSILETSGKTTKASESILLPSSPVAALAMPQKIDASRDVVVLTSARPEPILIRADADPTVNVTTTSDSDPQNACGQNSTVTVSNVSAPISLRAAVCAVNNSGAGTYTINVPAGTYDLSLNAFAGKLSQSESGELQVGFSSGANISIVGAGTSATIIEQTDGIDRVIEQDQLEVGDIPLTISNLTLTGGNCTSSGLDCPFSGGALIAGGITGDSLSLSSVVVKSNTEADSADGGNQGGGVAMAGPGFTITNSSFLNNSVASSSTNSGYGAGINFLDDVQGSLSITNSTFSGNTVAASSSSVPTQGGGLEISLSISGDTATVSGSTFTGNEALGTTAEGGGIFADGPTTVSNSRIVGNTAAAAGSGYWQQGGAGTATNNWWGCNAGPGSTGCDKVNASTVSGDNASVTFNPWLVLGISATATQINVGGTSDLTAAIDTNSSGGTGFSVPNGTAVTFGGTLGTVNPTSTTTSSGTASSVFTGTAPGAGSATATVDNQTVTVDITVNQISTSVAISASPGTTFLYGQPSSFTVQFNPSGASGITTGDFTVTVDGVSTGYGVTLISNNDYQITGPFNLVSPGSHTLKVSFSGTSDYAAANTSITIGVSKGTASVAGVVSPTKPIQFQGGSVQVTVTQSGSGVTPTGTVAYAFDGGTPGAVTLSSGSATIIIPTIIATGSHSLALTYSGDTNYAASGTTVDFTVYGRSETFFASLNSTSATIDVIGFGFTAPSGQLAFNDVTSGSPVAGSTTLNTTNAIAALAPQTTISTGANTLPDWTVLGDVNGDGNLDLVTSLYQTDSVSVQLGNGDGTFQAATNILIATGFGPAEAHLVSLRGNGTLDIVVGSFNTNQIAVLLGNDDGTFGSPTFYTIGSATNTTTSLTTGDFNDDGKLDVAVANKGDNTVSILLGTGSGSLTLQATPIAVGSDPEAIRAGDFTGDGYSDLAVANYHAGTVTTLLNNQNGTFTASTISVGSGAGSGPQALAITGSGSSLLLAVANYKDDTVSVMKSNGSGSFGAQTIVPVGNGPDDVNFADFNGDGIQDLVVSNYTDGTVDLLLGSSGGSYTVSGPFTVGNNPYSAAVGDIDHDGTPDVIVSNCFSNNTGVLLDGTEISTPYTGLSLTGGHSLNATYTPDGASNYGSSTSANVTAP